MMKQRVTGRRTMLNCSCWSAHPKQSNKHFITSWHWSNQQTATRNNTRSHTCPLHLGNKSTDHAEPIEPTIVDTPHHSIHQPPTHAVSIINTRTHTHTRTFFLSISEVGRNPQQADETNASSPLDSTPNQSSVSSRQPVRRPDRSISGSPSPPSVYGEQVQELRHRQDDGEGLHADLQHTQDSVSSCLQV